MTCFKDHRYYRTLCHIVNHHHIFSFRDNFQQALLICITMSWSIGKVTDIRFRYYVLSSYYIHTTKTKQKSENARKLYLCFLKGMFFVKIIKSTHFITTFLKREGIFTIIKSTHIIVTEQSDINVTDWHNIFSSKMHIWNMYTYRIVIPLKPISRLLRFPGSSSKVLRGIHIYRNTNSRRLIIYLSTNDHTYLTCVH